MQKASPFQLPRLQLPGCEISRRFWVEQKSWDGGHVWARVGCGACRGVRCPPRGAPHGCREGRRWWAPHGPEGTRPAQKRSEQGGGPSSLAPTWRRARLGLSERCSVGEAPAFQVPGPTERAEVSRSRAAATGTAVPATVRGPCKRPVRVIVSARVGTGASARGSWSPHLVPGTPGEGAAGLGGPRRGHLLWVSRAGGELPGRGAGDHGHTCPAAGRAGPTRAPPHVRSPPDISMSLGRRRPPPPWEHTPV